MNATCTPKNNKYTYSTICEIRENITSLENRVDELGSCDNIDDLSCLHFKYDSVAGLWDNKDTLSLLNTIVALKPDFLSLCKLAQFHLQVDNYKEAMRAIDLALRYRENDFRAIQVKVAILLLQKRKDDAFELLSSVPRGANESWLRSMENYALHLEYLPLYDCSRLIKEHVNSITLEYDLEEPLKISNEWNDVLERHLAKGVELPISDIIGTLESIPFNAITDRLLLVGSFAEGNANDGSDIDIYILTDFFKVDIHEYNKHLKRSINVKYFNTGYLKNLLVVVGVNEKIPEKWPGNTDYTVMLEYLHRLANSIPLNDPPFPAVDWPLVTPKDLYKSGAITHLKNVRGLWQDAAGAFAKGEKSQAAFSAEMGLWSAIDALACLEGLTNPSLKWRLKKVNQLDSLYPTFNQAKERLLSNRSFFENTEDLLLLLAESLYQITHKLVYGRYSQSSASHTTSERTEVVVSGDVKIDLYSSI
ncbi:hypothetical protein FKG94_25120 [Exilibacterium tricleocarpae]|uniref:Polymerase nucleotidyl transferase domain-containing protein n=1 Tax=Exilibacterium tricleocarpae TaxID=2591008 RepID=A0A545SRQ2_9GAMM|nr:nucleotidyltransferase domain-containing protein [Exilibacterium tricleocarpae]TQV67658.1 hypothetical protein FKG94_25120 [Exilibacterium tricleocarpae]